MKVIKLEAEITIPGIGDNVNLKDFCNGIADVLRDAIRACCIRYDAADGKTIEVALSFGIAEEENQDGAVKRDEWGATEGCDCTACRIRRKKARGEDFSEELRQLTGESDFGNRLADAIREKLDDLEKERTKARFN